MLEVTFCAQVPKDLNCPESVEDSLLIACNRHAVVISDGASESYDSKTWADLIVTGYLNDQSIDQRWVKQLIEKYESNFDFATLSWSKQASYERGSFATLLGVTLDGERHLLTIDGVGDCLTVLIYNTGGIFTFPYKCSSDFSQRPLLLSTRLNLNDQLFDPALKETISLITSSEGVETVLLMSDALAAWCLKRIEDHSEDWKRLLTFDGQTDFLDFVIAERHSKSLAVDDVTLMVVKVRD